MRLAPTIYLLLILIAATYVGAYPYQVRNILVEVYRDGSVMVLYDLVTIPPENISLRLPSEPFHVRVYTEGGDLPYLLEGDELIFISTSERASVEAYFYGLTSKEAEIWRLEIGFDTPYRIILPEGTIILSVSRENYGISFVNGSPALDFGPGNVTIEYVTSPPPIDGGDGVDGGGDDGADTGGIDPLPIILIVAIAAGATLIILHRGRKRFVEAVEDERDRLIIEALRRRPMTASELMEETGIPKSPLYRRLSKLVESGVVEVVREGQRRVYRLRE